MEPSIEEEDVIFLSIIACDGLEVVAVLAVLIDCFELKLRMLDFLANHDVSDFSDWNVASSIGDCSCSSTCSLVIMSVSNFEVIVLNNLILSE